MRVPVCKIGGAFQYGTGPEARAALLRPGDKVLHKGREETVATVWFYDGIIVDLESGGAIFPALGDEIEVVPPGPGEGEAK